jgi:heptose I phosphotransferase
MNELFLDENFSRLWNGNDPFAEADKLSGETFRHVKARHTFRFSLNGKSYFAKVHHGVGWKEIFKNLLQCKSTVLGAGNEWAAINKLKSLGVATMTVCAYGSRGLNPATQDSFIITEDLNPAISLEDYCRNWRQQPPAAAIKFALIKLLAKSARIMHTNGINHRDFYICHFLLDIRGGIEQLTANNLTASLIDLHRAQIRSKTPYRWLVKDVAGLWFSAMDIGLTQHDKLRFIREYSGGCISAGLVDNAKFWQDVNRTALKLYKKEFGRLPDNC